MRIAVQRSFIKIGLHFWSQETFCGKKNSNTFMNYVGIANLLKHLAYRTLLYVMGRHKMVK